MYISRRATFPELPNRRPFDGRAYYLARLVARTRSVAAITLDPEGRDIRSGAGPAGSRSSHPRSPISAVPAHRDAALIAANPEAEPSRSLRMRPDRRVAPCMPEDFGPSARTPVCTAPGRHENHRRIEGDHTLWEPRRRRALGSLPRAYAPRPQRTPPRDGAAGVPDAGDAQLQGGGPRANLNGEVAGLSPSGFDRAALFAAGATCMLTASCEHGELREEKAAAEQQAGQEEGAVRSPRSRRWWRQSPAPRRYRKVPLAGAPQLALRGLSRVVVRALRTVECVCSKK